MPTRKIIILGIAPGTKTTGIALVRGAYLVEWRVRTWKGPWSEKKCKRIIESLERTIKKERVRVVALKVSHPSRASTGLKNMEERIHQRIGELGIPVHLCTIDCLKRCTCQMNKRGVAKILLEKYPQLQHEYEQEKTNRNSYHMKIFEAVCAIEDARLHLEELL